MPFVAHTHSCHTIYLHVALKRVQQLYLFPVGNFISQGCHLKRVVLPLASGPQRAEKMLLAASLQG
jgi:hypothetical protein